MDKTYVNSLPPEQRCKMAVAYLMRNKSEQPKELTGLFEKLEGYEKSAASTNVAIAQGREALSQLETRFYHLLGSIDTMSDVITEKLKNEPEDKINEWCEKYQPPKTMPNIQSGRHLSGVDVSGHSNVPADVDIAGSTANKD